MPRTYDDLSVIRHDDAEALGRATATRFAEEVRARLATQSSVGVIVQTGGSQRPFYDALEGIELDWSRIDVFHLDEYVGIPSDHPACFGRWIRERVVERFGARTFHAFDSEAGDAAVEAVRYGEVLRSHAPQICVMSVGEQGQVAFVEPPAEFATLEPVTIVELAESSRQQQVRQGFFPCYEDTPAAAWTMTVPALLSCERVLVTVPERRKAEAVRATLEGSVSRAVPASMLRLCPRAELHLDADAASLLAG